MGSVTFYERIGYTGTRRTCKEMNVDVNKLIKMLSQDYDKCQKIY